LILATRKGLVKRCTLEALSAVRSNGLIAMKLLKDDELVAVRVAVPDDEVILVTGGAQSIRFAVSGLRVASRTSGGVRGIHLAPDDRVVSMDIVIPEGYMLVLTKDGHGKCSNLANYRSQSRGGVGIKTLSLKAGRVIAARVIHVSDEVMILSTKGVIIRMKVENIPVQGRIRRGASIMKVDEGDEVTSIAALRLGD
jgi:DNA gyrase subunit A